MSDAKSPDTGTGDENKWPFSERKKKLFEDYFGLLAGNAQQSTINTRKSNLRTFFAWVEEKGIELEEFQGYHMTRYASDLQNRGFADPSIGACVDAVAIWYVWLVEENPDFEIETNPLEGWSLGDHSFLKIDPNTAKQTVILRDRGDTDDAIIALPKANVEKIIAHPGSPSLLKELIIRLYWETGVRGVELANIKQRDIDRERRRIRIVTAKTKPKDPNRTRYVYYSDATDYLFTEWLDYGERSAMNPSAPEWKDEDKRDEEADGYDYDEHDADDWDPDEEPYLLLTDKKPKIRPSWASRVVKEAAISAGVNEPLYRDAAGKKRWLVTGHTLRHSHISYHCNQLETPLHMVAKLAGHRKLDTTKQYVTTDWDAIERRAKQFF